MILFIILFIILVLILHKVPRPIIARTYVNGVKRARELFMESVNEIKIKPWFKFLRPKRLARSESAKLMYK